MQLEDSFTAISPCVIGFISKLRSSVPGQQPIFPSIIGTGFFVDPTGLAVTNRHVIECFDKIPRNPKTGEFPVAAFMFLPGDSGKSMQFLALDIKKWIGLQSFDTTQWYGQSLPDIGFVQLSIREVPHLKLATEDFYLKVGMRISTVGYPMGDLPLTALGKLNQMTPFLRQGIVSSVFPFPVPKPHGFTIDVMQQGGSSGSPIFAWGETTVVGMMSGSLIDHAAIQIGNDVVAIPQNTNISVAESGPIVQLALDEFRRQHPSTLDGVPTLEEIRAQYPEENKGELDWESLGVFRQIKNQTGEPAL
jgi:V8-like Glu-specific endopeptidase